MDEQQQERDFPKIRAQNFQNELANVDQYMQNILKLSEELKNKIRAKDLVPCEDTIRKLESDSFQQAIKGAVRKLAAIHNE